MGVREMSWWWSVVSADCGHHCCGVLHPCSALVCVLLLGDRSVEEGLEIVSQARFLRKWVWLARLGWRVDQRQNSGSGNDDLLLTSLCSFLW